MSVDVNKLATLKHLENLATRTVAAIAPTFKSAEVDGNTVKFYTSSDTSGTPAFTFDFAEEIFLDQAGTELVQNFAFSAATSPNSTNPNLDGKTVLVLAVKGDKQTNPTVKYSFIDVEALIDIYTASDTSITISGYNVKVNIDPAATNLLSLTANGLMVDASGKIDKVTSPTTGNVPLLASDGSLTNSTIVGGNVLSKVAGATEGNLVIFASDGSIVDSTYSIATDAEVNTVLDALLPTISGGA